MPLVATNKMLLNARDGAYAVAAFNVENMEMIQAVISAASELHAPVIVQTTPSTVSYAGLAVFYAHIAALAKHAEIPLALHLDHGDSFDLAVRAVREGYTSVMIDGSHHAFEENIELTRRVVDVAGPNNIPVEAELGRIGGKEDDLDGGEEAAYTDPAAAKEFIRRTGAASLAVAIGTAHGVYTGVPKLDIARLGKIAEAVHVPLVLHGASGIPDETIKKCIANGISKVNYATELRIAYSNGVKQVLGDDPDVFDPKKYGAAGRARVKELAMKLINLCGCSKRA